MKIVILSTLSIRHKYLLAKINKKFKIKKIIIETSSVTPKFNVIHPFEKKRDIYEKKNFNLKDFKKIRDDVFFKCKNINNRNVLKILIKLNPDIIIASGIRIIRPEIVKKFKKKIYNLHGGNILKYRGLDSHLWSIYHNDFKNLDIILHRLSNKVDTGNIILKNKIKIDKKTNLINLRVKNIEIAIKLVLKFLKLKKNKDNIKEVKIRKIGRYYSHMPSALKQVCIDKLKKYKNNEFK
jgi:methionyl-tRNA formyltransferase